MPWYQFDQTNARGHLIQNDKVDRLVFIEADRACFANCIAQEDLGIYFGSECDCCGDRWNEAEDHEGLVEPGAWDWKVSQDHMPADMQSLYGTGTVHLYHKDGTHEQVTLSKGYVISRTRS